MDSCLFQYDETNLDYQNTIILINLRYVTRSQKNWFLYRLHFVSDLCLVQFCGLKMTDERFFKSGESIFLTRGCMILSI